MKKVTKSLKSDHVAFLHFATQNFFGKKNYSFFGQDDIRIAARRIERQCTDCGPDRGFCSNKSTWIGFRLMIKPFRISRWSGSDSSQWKKMEFLQGKCHIDWLQLSLPANQNDRVSAQVNKIKRMIGWLLAELKIHKITTFQLSHYWLELHIPEWVSLVWPMPGLSSSILC